MTMKISDKELATLYIQYKKQKKYYKEIKKERCSLVELNHYLEIKRCLTMLKVEMSHRGLTKKQAKKMCK